jgi:chloramphenicol-sensitive protein RarD
MSRADRSLTGAAFALGAFLTWGLNPIYFKAVGHVPASEILAHRVAWCFVLLAVVLIVTRRIGALLRDLAPRRTRLLLLLSPALICANFLTFIHAVLVDRLIESSLGYFLNPIVNVFLGVLFLGERLRRGQLLALGLAFTGVAWLIVDHGHLPWITLVLAFSFGTYGLVRKVAKVEAVGGLAVACGLVFLPCVAFIAWRAWGGSGSFLNFFQYLAPTGQLLLAVLAYGEVFTRAHAVAFGFIWSALAVFTVESLRHRRAQARLSPDAER